jgi:hypothetical protein
MRLPIVVDHELPGRYKICPVFSEIINKYTQREYPDDRKYYEKLFKKYSKRAKISMKNIKIFGVFQLFNKYKM